MGDLADAANASLQRLGYPIWPEDAYRRMVGNGARLLMERALGEACTPQRTEALLKEFLGLYDEGCLRRTHPYAGIPELLKELRRRGIRMAVVTNKPQAQAVKIVTHYFGASYFEFVYGGCPERRKKPDPAVVLDILDAWRMPKENALFVGDSDVDVLTAIHAGMRSAGAVWGFRGEEELRRAGANFLLQKPENLLNCY